MQVALRVAGTSLAGIETAAVAALDDFFGETPYEYTMSYIQGDQDYDESGKPIRYQGDIQATTDIIE